MEVLQAAGQALISLIRAVYNLLWGDLIQIPLPGGSTLGLSLLVIILIPAGIYFTVRTRFLPFRLFPRDDPRDRGGQGHGRGHLGLAGADRVHRVPRGHGQPGRRGRGDFRGRRRRGVLDVGYCTARLIDRVYRGHARTDL